jgi:hypothetical protein
VRNTVSFSVCKCGVFSCFGNPMRISSISGLHYPILF